MGSPAGCCVCTWLLLGLAVKVPWLVPGDPTLALAAWTGLENATLIFTGGLFLAEKSAWALSGCLTTESGGLVGCKLGKDLLNVIGSRCTYLYLSLSTSLSTSLSVCYLSTYQCVLLSVYVSITIYLSVCLSVLPIYLSEIYLSS